MDMDRSSSQLMDGQTAELGEAGQGPPERI